MFTIIWTSKSFDDISEIYFYLSHKLSIETAEKIIDEIFAAPNSITFLEQFQVDGFRKDCRRIIVRNYKILYQVKGSEIYILRVFNSYQNPTKSL